MTDLTNAPPLPDEPLEQAIYRSTNGITYLPKSYSDTLRAQLAEAQREVERLKRPSDMVLMTDKILRDAEG